MHGSVTGGAKPLSSVFQSWSSLRQAISGSRVDRLLLAFSLSFFVLACVVALHGFSIGAWQHVLGLESPIGKVLFGEPRGIRSDDWLSTLPNIFAQIAQQPPFPVQNRNMFLGQNMLAQYVPIIHSVTFFRPTLWGYFLSPDVGMAWQWWGRFFGLAAALYIFQTRTLGVSRTIALPLTMLFIYSPFIQFWSMNSAEIYIFALLPLIFARSLFAATNLRAGLIYGLLAGYSSAGLFFTLYPPYQIVLGWYCLIVVLAVVACFRNRQTSGFWLAGSLLGFLLLSGAIADWYLDSRELIANMTGTAYPGNRFFHGGGMQLGRMFVSNLFADRYVSHWDRYGNICESASFALLFPIGMVSGLGFARGFKDRFQFFVFWGSLFYCFFVFCFLVFGFPDVLARYSLFSQVLTQRALGGMGLASTIATGLGVHAAITRPRRNFNAKEFRSWMLPTVCGLAVGLSIYFVGRQVHADLGVRLSLVNRAAIFYFLAATLLFCGKRSVLAVFAAAGFWSTGYFNPLVIGGYSDLTQTSIARLMSKVAEDSPGSGWIGLGQSEIGNYIKILGHRTYSGIQFEPQNRLWSQLDSSQKFKDVYNRYAHVTVNVQSGSQNKPSFVLTAADCFSVWLNSQSDFFAQNGIDFGLTAGNGQLASDSEKRAGFVLAGQAEKWRIIRRQGASEAPSP